MCCKTDACFIDGAQFGGLVDRPSGQMMPWHFITEYFNKKEGAVLSRNDVQERMNRTFGLSQSRSKGESMKYECTYKKECADKIKWPSENRYEPAQIQSITRPVDQRYYKLFDGDVLDMETKTILVRSDVLKLMD